MKRSLSALVLGAAVATAISGPAVAAVPSNLPSVIGGTPGSPLASAAVALEIHDGLCTASLWRSRILITAAHCISDSETGAATTQPGDITIYPPGADISGGPARVKVTQILFDPQWTTDAPDGEWVLRDIAYLILEAPLGLPTWSRMATPAEIVELARAGAEIEYIGYGYTGPRDDPASRTSAVPQSLKSRLVPADAGGTAQFVFQGDGIRGTCAGDSGGPFLAIIGGAVVYLGPLHGGAGLPCDSEQDDPLDYAAVASGMPELAQQALAAAGEPAEATPTTCVEGPDIERQCVLGTVWNYDYCWSGTRAVLQVRAASGWKTVKKVTGRRNIACNRSSPYEITIRVTSRQPRTSYRLVLPKQPGLLRGAVDPFTVTIG